MDPNEGLTRFDVAIWRRWPGDDLPVIGMVTASDGASAVVAVMRAFHLTRATHVAASDQQQRLVY